MVMDYECRKTEFIISEYKNQGALLEEDITRSPREWQNDVGKASKKGWDY
jgi:hypothetical protein